METEQKTDSNRPRKYEQWFEGSSYRPSLSSRMRILSPALISLPTATALVSAREEVSAPSRRRCRCFPLRVSMFPAACFSCKWLSLSSSLQSGGDLRQEEVGRRAQEVRPSRRQEGTRGRARRWPRRRRRRPGRTGRRRGTCPRGGPQRSAPPASSSASASSTGAAVPAAKQQKAAAGRPDARNRRALGDIGNLVHAHVLDGKIQLPEGINRPITRSFGAQLLKNAQANGAAANKNAIAPAHPAAARAAPKPAANRKAPAKPAPRPEQATKISAGPDENKKPSEGVGRKVVDTLTSVLTARSKPEQP